jgi:hypothetical protein
MQTKIFLLLITGLPGLFKLLSLFIIKFKFDNEVLGLYTNDIAFVLTVSLFTGIGWGALLLKLIPSLNQGRSIQVFFNIVLYSVISLCIIVPLLLVAYNFGYIFDITGVISLLVVTSLYYIVRHYLLSKREYKNLLLIELSIPLLFISLFCFFSNASNLLFITSFSFVFCLLYILFLFIKLYKSKYSIRAHFYKKHVYDGVQFSINNFISGGVINMLPIVFLQVGGPIYAGFIGILLNLINSFMLVPRALANFKIVSLQLAIKNKNEIYELFSFRKIMLIANVVGFICALVILLSFIQYEDKYSKLDDVYFTTLFLLMTVFISSQNLVEGNYLFLKGMQKYSIYSNIFYFSGFSFLYLMLNIFETKRLDVFVFSIMILSILRYFYLFGVTNKKGKKHIET